MELLDRLEQTFCTLKKPNMSQLKEAITDLGSLLEQIPSYCTEPGQLPYGRNMLVQNEDIEVVVIHLPGEKSTPIHDHGGSIGCAHVIEGSLLDVSYALDEHGYPLPVKESEAKAGELLEETAGQIHRLINPNKERMISLHAYAPPLKGSKKYIPYLDILDFVI
jgi:cysteine dioxygenase